MEVFGTNCLKSAPSHRCPSFTSQLCRLGLSLARSALTGGFLGFARELYVTRCASRFLRQRLGERTRRSAVQPTHRPEPVGPSFTRTRRKYGRDTNRLLCHPLKDPHLRSILLQYGGTAAFRAIQTPIRLLSRIATVALIFERFQVSYHLRKKFLPLRNVLRQIRERN